MNERLPEESVFMKDGHAVTTSLKVAEVFGKNHLHVLRSIRNIIEVTESKIGFSDDATEPNFGLSEQAKKEFTALNFELSEYIDSTGRTLPMYEMTRDGFSLLAMGFTGPKALQFKIAFINRFNAMEAMLKNDLAGALAHAEAYWFARRPHWPPIRVRVLAGMTYRAIAEALKINRSRVSYAVRKMIELGLVDAYKVAEKQIGPAKAAALRYAEKFNPDPRQMLLEF